MTRPASLLQTTSVLALLAASLAGCATQADAPHGMGYRHMSIKDSPVDAASAAPRVHKVAVSRPAVSAAPKSQTHDSAPAPVIAKPADEPRPVLPVEPKKPSEAAIEMPKASPPPDQKSLPVAPPPKAAEKPAPAELRPLSEGRRVAANDPGPKPQAQPTLQMPPATEVKTAEPKPVEVKPAEPKAPEPKPTVNADVPKVEPVAPPVAVAKPAAPPAIVVAPLPKAEPKAATLSPDQKVGAALAQVDEYMKAGRYLNARGLLEDAAKAGNPEILMALAETYDTLVLREKYPKLARIGDETKALATYELAKAKGATGADQRIAALRALKGQR